MRGFICLIALFALLKSAQSIRCYVCNATDTTTPFQCGEWFERFDTPDIEPQECSSVHGAQYCIKHIGRFEAFSINCYQCSAAETMECSDVLINMPGSPLEPQPCDHVYDAQYCIKSTALNGGIGAKRYCSSKDLGNYCNYVQNKGDRMEYRSCIFTCSTDGCNNTARFLLSKVAFLLIPIGFVLSLLRH
ncbi:uncharacterized protein LOC119647997 [Hermetia illucens]|uniref:uncharacterized protein LOC119647997 n=1 Tax=Hermetia illucens TaxID=343691 RepID=UPI0018CC4148|nr:uncharacterized protein LOC119647997 [Hermetia illucens]